jgi:hypothetical protein
VRYSADAERFPQLGENRGTGTSVEHFEPRCVSPDVRARSEISALTTLWARVFVACPLGVRTAFSPKLRELQWLLGEYPGAETTEMAPCHGPARQRWDAKGSCRSFIPPLRRVRNNAPIRVNETLTLLFGQATSFDSHHYAFHVSDAEFDAIFERIKKGRAFIWQRSLEPR